MHHHDAAENAHVEDSTTPTGAAPSAQGTVQNSERANDYVADGLVGVVVIDVESVLGARCRTCDGYMCLDCADGAQHTKCTRTCPHCVLDTVDWDGELEKSDIITELIGLYELERAISELVG